MFLSYNHVPFNKEYRELHNINDDLSNSSLCYDGNDAIFKDIEQDKILYLPLNEVLVKTGLIESDYSYINLIFGDRLCPVLFNNIQNKFQVYFALEFNEKEYLSFAAKQGLWAKYYYELVDDGNIIHSYFSFNNKEEQRKKFWTFNVTIEI